jgi:hypothetical protein
MAAPSPRSPRIPTLGTHKATGQAVVRLNGQDVYCGKAGTPEAQAKYDRVIAEWLERGRLAVTPAAPSDPAVAPSTGLSVAELILAYKNYCDDYYRNSPSEQQKIKMAVRPLRHLYGLTPAAAFGPLAFKATRAKLLEPQQRTVAVRDKKGVKVGEHIVPYRLARRTINQRNGRARCSRRRPAGRRLVR